MPPTNMRYWIHFSIVSLVTAYLIIGYIAFCLFWPVKTLEIVGYNDSNPVVIQNDVIHKGDILIYDLNYCKYTNKSSIVHRSLIDGQIINLADTPGRLPTGCHTTTIQTAIIPETINPGTYYLDVTVEYDVNPFRTEYLHYKTTYFTVAK